MRKWILALALLVTSIGQAETKVLMVSGSTRDDSYNKKLLIQAAEQISDFEVSITQVDLSDYPMPLYDGDLEAKSGMPPHAKRLRDQILASKVIVIASPEYNGSLSGVLKNAIDWASRNEKGEYSREAFDGKIFAIMSASLGPLGGKRGLVHLRQILSNVGGVVIAQEVTLPNAHTVFDNPEKVNALNLELNELMKEAFK